MSKIGRQSIKIPEAVTVGVSEKTIKVIGPKGTLERHFPRKIGVEVKDGNILVLRKGDSKTAKSLHGTYRSLINSMVVGVTQGFSRQLEIIGTGFRAEVVGRDLSLTVGYSHPIKVLAPEGINFKVEKAVITVEGSNKEVVGQAAADIRAVRPPEPYKGKGIKYATEVVRRKPGKAAAKATAT